MVCFQRARTSASLNTANCYIVKKRAQGTLSRVRVWQCCPIISMCLVISPTYVQVWLMMVLAAFVMYLSIGVSRVLFNPKVLLRGQHPQKSTSRNTRYNILFVLLAALAHTAQARPDFTAAHSGPEFLRRRAPYSPDQPLRFKQYLRQVSDTNIMHLKYDMKLWDSTRILDDMISISDVTCTDDSLTLSLEPGSDPELVSLQFQPGSVVAGGKEWGCHFGVRGDAVPFTRRVHSVSISTSKNQARIKLTTSVCGPLEAFEDQDIEIWSEDSSRDLRVRKPPKAQGQTPPTNDGSQPPTSRGAALQRPRTRNPAGTILVSRSHIALFRPMFLPLSCTTNVSERLCICVNAAPKQSPWQRLLARAHNPKRLRYRSDTINADTISRGKAFWVQVVRGAIATCPLRHKLQKPS